MFTHEPFVNVHLAVFCKLFMRIKLVNKVHSTAKKIKYIKMFIVQSQLWSICRSVCILDRISKKVKSPLGDATHQGRVTVTL